MPGQVFGTILFAYVIGRLVGLVFNLDPAERAQKNAVEYLKNYIMDLQLPRPARKQLLRHYGYRIQFKSVFEEDAILDLLPPHLRHPAMLFLHRNTLPRVPWLCELELRYHGNTLPVATTSVALDLKSIVFARHSLRVDAEAQTWILL